MKERSSYTLELEVRVGDPACIACELCAKLLSGRQLSGETIASVSVFSMTSSGLGFGLVISCPYPHPQKYSCCTPSSLSETMNATFWHRSLPLFWSHAQTSGLLNGPRTQASLLLNSKLGIIQPA